MVMGENEEVGCLWFVECELWFVVCGLFLSFLFIYFGVCDCGCDLRSVIGGVGVQVESDSPLAGLSW